MVFFPKPVPPLLGAFRTKNVTFGKKKVGFKAKNSGGQNFT